VQTAWRNKFSPSFNLIVVQLLLIILTLAAHVYCNRPFHIKEEGERTVMSFFRNPEELKHKKNGKNLSSNAFQSHYFTSDSLSGACDELSTTL